MANYMTKEDCIKRGIKALNKIEFLSNEQRDKIIEIIGVKYRNRSTILKSSRTYNQLWNVSHNLMIWAIEKELDRRLKSENKCCCYKLSERFGNYVIENLVTGVESGPEELEIILDHLDYILKTIEIDEMKQDIKDLYEVAEEIKEVKEKITKAGLNILIDYRKVVNIYDNQLNEILAKKHNQFLEIDCNEIIKKYHENLLNDLVDNIFLEVQNLREYLTELLTAYHKVSKKQTETNIIGLINEYNENDGQVDASKFEDPEAIVDIMNTEQIGVMYDRNNKIIISELPF